MRELRDCDFELVTMAPWKKNIEALARIYQWSQKHNRSFNTLFNNLLPSIAYCLEMYTLADVEGNPVVEFNLGKVSVINAKKLPWMKNKKKIN